jgi:hypothetical protein
MNAILRLQEALLQLPQVPLTTGHFFCNGMYIRILLIRKGCAIVGRVHKQEHFFMVLSGDISIANGEASVRFKGTSCPLVSKPGVKRAGLAHEDTLVMTIHRTDKTDIAEIEEEISEPDPNSAYLPGNVLKPHLLNGEGE